MSMLSFINQPEAQLYVICFCFYNYRINLNIIYIRSKSIFQIFIFYFPEYFSWASETRVVSRKEKKKKKQEKKSERKKIGGESSLHKNAIA